MHGWIDGWKGKRVHVGIDGNVTYTTYTYIDMASDKKDTKKKTNPGALSSCGLIR